MSKTYDWILIIGLAYMLLGTDFTNGLLGGLATGDRTDPDKNIFQKMLYKVHAKNDPMMRAKPEPLYGEKDTLPPFLANMGYTNLLVGSAFEIALIYGLVDAIKNKKTGPIPNWLKFISAAFIYRGITEIMYAIQLGYNTVDPIVGSSYLWYWLIAGPQIYLPFFDCREVL